ncbi:cupin domain-containing protein [Hymenobacter properus]|uniref:Cupin domain-containing protein n=1 Tax=Hymenobacter properus TaxID=2791026 RepID=A0A931FNG6_9BACT|nr:cupin domain-containing protein [Hymenobacter properus]MBF9144121.1 cupin domain-containing protein [Hymenobacter properus]MBR7722937.1 cupin domain-containing protein [Microvirga sp. SRT04]
MTTVASESTVPHAFVTDGQAEWETTGHGVRRKVLAHGPDLMLTRVAFETGGVGARHNHPHAQLSYVESGAFAYTIGEETQTLRTGDSCYVPPLAWHGVECLEAGVLVDAFTPRRDDFLA